MPTTTTPQAASEEVLKIPCNHCKTTTKHKAVVTAKEHYSEEQDGGRWQFHAVTEHSILTCLGCDTVTYRSTSTNSEDYGMTDEGEHFEVETTAYFPPRTHGRDPLEDLRMVPIGLHQIYNETINALNNALPILAGIGLRALVEGLCNELEAEGRNLRDQIDNLVTKGHLTQGGAEILHSIRYLGNKAAHNAKPHATDALNVALRVVEHTLTGAYILPQHAKIVFKKQSQVLELAAPPPQVVG
jgi:hypothetical protein